jgi:hypothetical protein
VYVEVGHFIEPLTKLSVTLDLPGPRGATRIETEAIVVRTQPEREQPGTDRYQIACAFLSLSDPHRSTIRQWVAAQRTHAPLRN